MKLQPYITTMLLAGHAALASHQAIAQPHAQVRVEDVTVPTPPMDEWLRRLVGRYNVEGVIEMVFYPPESGRRCGQLPPDPAQQDDPPPPVVPFCQAIKGQVDCAGVGTGPGVQCILEVAWRDIYEVGETGAFNLPGGEPFLGPAMALFGLDPRRSALNYLLVDNKGLPEGGLGLPKGNRVTFRTPCVNAPILFNAMNPDLRVDDQRPRICERAVYLDAKPEAKLVNMMMDIEINEEPFTRLMLTLRRLSQDEMQKSPKTRP